MEYAGPSKRDRESGFRPVILDRDGRFCVYLAELEIAGVGDTVEAAYAEYKLRLAEAILVADEWGVGARCIEPHPIRRKTRVDELLMFTAKAVIAVFVTIFLVVAFLPNIKAAYCKLSGGEGAICARR